jgi:DUF971 family protein
MNEQPTQLAQADDVLLITWSDGRQLRYDLGRLRGFCPCASCRAERARLNIPEGEPVPVEPGVRVQQMTPVGNYGYKIRFSDGHDTGIYTLAQLRGLGV